MSDSGRVGQVSGFARFHSIALTVRAYISHRDIGLFGSKFERVLFVKPYFFAVLMTFVFQSFTVHSGLIQILLRTMAYASARVRESRALKRVFLSDIRPAICAFSATSHTHFPTQFVVSLKRFSHV